MKAISSVLFSATLVLSGCTGANLDIFPPLENPGLMQEKIAPELLHADIDALLEGARQRHPDFAGYADEAGLRQLAATLKADINQPLTRVEFFRYVGQLSHAFGDGHSFLLWPYQELKTQQAAGAKIFPFAVTYKADSLIVNHTYQAAGQQLPAASQLVKINGVSIDEILQKTQLYVGGETATLRKAFVADRLPYMLWAVFGFVSQFDVEFRHQGKLQHLSVKPEQQWTITDNQQTAQDSLSYRRLEHDVGYLNVPTFDVDPDDFSTQLAELFSQIATDRVTSLIIDIRSNTGGNTDTAAELASYLADKPFRLVSQMSEKLNQDNRGLFGYKGHSGELISSQWQDYEKPVTAAKRFNGKVVVLIGPLTYSAAIVFATTVQDNQLGLLAGNDTGGFANQSGQGNLFNLPNSQLRAYVATRLLLRPSGDATQQPVRPDLSVAQTSSDATNHIDTTLQQVIQLLNTGGLQAKR